MVSSLLRQLLKCPATVPEREDIFQYPLGPISTDDLQIQHGAPGNTIKYRSNGYGFLEYEVVDPQGEEERTKFAYLWNTGVLMSELVGGQGKERDAQRHDHHVSEEKGWERRSFDNGKKWWLDVEEEKHWNVKGETVLELGAGCVVHLDSQS